jgi:four helix bundle protein
MNNEKQTERKRELKHFRDLEVYNLAFQCAMELFHVSRDFPFEEKYSLTDQIRRSSRSVCACIAEAWRKRRYKAYFKNKLTDAMSEASETQTWLEFSNACNYMDRVLFEKMDSRYEQIIGMLNAMEKKAESFCFNVA